MPSIPSARSVKARPKCCLTWSVPATLWWSWRPTDIMFVQTVLSSTGWKSYAVAAAYASSIEEQQLANQRSCFTAKYAKGAKESKTKTLTTEDTKEHRGNQKLGPRICANERE